MAVQQGGVLSVYQDRLARLNVNVRAGRARLDAQLFELIQQQEAAQALA
jgi:hypothetical protein